VISREIITFMRKLDVKEIHGYHAAAGLKLLTPDALAARLKARGRPDRAAGVRVGIPGGVELASDGRKHRSSETPSRSAGAVKVKR
jgi:hypothetical protein